MEQKYYEYAPQLFLFIAAIIGFCAYNLEYVLGLHILDAKIFWILFTGVLAFLAGFAGSLVKRLYKMSCTDPLTGLWNRRYFYRRLSEEVSRSQRYGSPLCLAMIDLDDFKDVNDKYGHDIGDQVLLTIVNLCLTNMRDSDVLARWGGDEFVAILPETAAENGMSVMKRIRNSIEKNPDLHGATVSIGLIPVEPGADISQLLRRADSLLYRAKENKNLVTSFE